MWRLFCFNSLNKCYLWKYNLKYSQIYSFPVHISSTFVKFKKSNPLNLQIGQLKFVHLNWKVISSEHFVPDSKSNTINKIKYVFR